MCDLFGCNFFLAQDEEQCFGTVVVSDREDGVVVTGLRQFCDEVEGNDLKGFCARTGEDG